MLSLADQPHRRYNPLTDEWVLVSPQRVRRPWQGQVELPAAETRPAYDPQCYLCPGNPRADGACNPVYERTFVFDNDFAALLPDTPPSAITIGNPPLLRATSERGLCRVICYSPRHDLSLSQLTPAELRGVVETWSAQYLELSMVEWISQVLIFENHGAMMGASNPHPHGQLWATSFLPNQMARECASQAHYYAANGRTLLDDYLRLELASGERLVCANEHVVALVPFWATWPFETLVLPRRPVASLPALTPVERDALADMLRQLLSRYDALFAVRFPYSMGLHQAPTDAEAHPEWHMHMHFLPPLLRSASVRKFMVGFELLGEPQRDLTPEQAAARLRALVV